MRAAPARACLALVALLLTSGFQGVSAPPPSPFADWAAVVVAADWRASSGKPTPAFENARRDVSAALLAAGFRPENLRTFSVEPKSAGVGETTPANVFRGVLESAQRTRAGCLVYLTSHGSPRDIVFGKSASLTPRALARLLNGSCGARPTVVIVSACYSGVFIPSLAAPNRLILTAARRDRASFGCGEDDVYPFFDACVLQHLPRSEHFLALGRAVQTCVAQREAELKLSPASEPQISVGARIRPLIPLLSLRSGPAAS